MSDAIGFNTQGQWPDQTIHGLAVPRTGVVSLIAEDHNADPGCAMVSLTPEAARNMARFLIQAADVVSVVTDGAKSTPTP